MASRHLSRSIALQSLFEWDFYGQVPEAIDAIVKRNIAEFGPGLETHDFIWQLVRGTIQHLPQIDKIITGAAPEWPIPQITIVDRNVLRLGLEELLYADKEEVPPKVAINEAIELAKTFGGESSGKFVNGVLGTVFAQIESLQGKSPEEAVKGKNDLPLETLSGGAVYRLISGRYQIALLLDAFDRWTLPKGHAEANETAEETALREVKEELGLEDLKIVTKLGEREYVAHEPDKGAIRRKVIDFLIAATGQTELKIEKSGGIKDGRWFNLDEIAGLKQYSRVRPVLETIIEVLAQKSQNVEQL